MAYGCELCSTCHVMGIFVDTVRLYSCYMLVYVFIMIWLHELTKRIGSEIGSENWCLKFVFSFVSISTGVEAYSSLRCVMLFALFILDLMSIRYGICKFSCLILLFIYFSRYCSGLLWCVVVLFALLLLDLIGS